MQELLNQQLSQQTDVEEEKKERAQEERKEILRKIMTPEARERLGRIRLVKPEFAQQIEDQLIYLTQSGRLRSQVDDAMLKKILAQLQQDKDIKIRRVEK
jgi:programmed cell death protein 5